ncbi:MAG: alpha/beta hydrolase [bacterium]|nr:alpha/beta hydrolase [bacterium]
MMIDLQKITTRDGLILHGGVVWPLHQSRRSGAGRARSSGETAIILVHGLMGRFYTWFDRVSPLIAIAERQKIAVAAFNTRGNHVVSYDTYGMKKKTKRGVGGGACERFEECVYDIGAMVDFFVRKGYRNVILVGHSTGANKVAYYVAKTKDRRVKKLVLLSAIADPVIARREYGHTLRTHLQSAKRAVRRGDGDKFLMSTSSDPLLTPKRFLSLYTPGGAEDVFPYYNSKGNWRAMEGIRVPLLAIVGDHDQFLDRDAGEYMEVFQKHVRDFRGTIIAGADHSFNKREKELARAVARFVLGR